MIIRQVRPVKQIHRCQKNVMSVGQMKAATAILCGVTTQVLGLADAYKALGVVFTRKGDR